MTQMHTKEKNYAAWSYGNVVQFYAGQRRTVEEVYDSERALLLPAVESCESVLDIGCAAGGFYEIFQALKPSIRYVGLDVAADMIATARQRYPSVPFDVSDGDRLKTPDASYDLTFCTGVLLHNPNFRDMIRECYRVAARSCIIDLPRLVSVPYTFDRRTSYMTLKHRFEKGAAAIDAQQTIVPYVLSNPQPMFEWLIEGLRPRPRALAAVGYYGHPNESVTLPVTPICFCVIFLAKGDARTQRTAVAWDLPEDITAALSLSDVEEMGRGREAIARLIRLQAVGKQGSRHP